MLKDINLQLFGDEPVSAGVSTDATAGASGIDTSSFAGENPTAEGGSAEGTEPSFDELITGKFKNEYSARVEKAIKDRLKGSKAEIKERDEVLKIVGEKYKWDGKNIAALKEAITNDDSLIEAEAIERGMDIDTLKYIKGLERANAANEAARAEQEEEARIQSQINSWMEESKTVQETYPDFDLRTEMQSNQFRMLLGMPGVNMLQAYEMCHLDMVRNQVKQSTVQAVSNNIQSRAARPQESANKPMPSADIRKDISKLTMKEMDELIARAGRGERLTLK